MMHGGVSAPSCCAFTHRVAFEEVSGHRVLIKGIPIIFSLVLLAQSSDSEGTTQLHPHWGVSICLLFASWA